MITEQTLFTLGIDPGIWFRPLADAMGLHAIDTDDREAMFVAQAAHESGGFRHLVEHLNYSPTGLLSVFGRYFTPAEASTYSHQPQKIASRVYANRMGNGDEASGEGWQFRGRGIIQLTGRQLYDRCGRGLGVNLVDAPELLEQPLYAALSAAWYWHVNGLNDLADSGSFAAITRRINGGLTGEEDREGWLARVRRAMT